MQSNAKDSSSSFSKEKKSDHLSKWTFKAAKIMKNVKMADKTLNKEQQKRHQLNARGNI